MLMTSDTFMHVKTIDMTQQIDKYISNIGEQALTQDDKNEFMDLCDMFEAQKETKLYFQVNDNMDVVVQVFPKAWGYQGQTKKFKGSIRKNEMMNIMK